MFMLSRVSVKADFSRIRQGYSISHLIIPPNVNKPTLKNMDKCVALIYYDLMMYPWLSATLQYIHC